MKVKYVEQFVDRLGNIRFYCPSWITIARAKTALIKEKETIEWINTNWKYISNQPLDYIHKQ